MFNMRKEQLKSCFYEDYTYTHVYIYIYILEGLLSIGQEEGVTSHSKKCVH